MKFGMPFGSVDALLAESHRITSEKRSAFQARLKNFMRLGLFDGLQIGRGRAAEFQAGQVLLFALALELGQLGVGPERSVEILRANAKTIAEAVAQSVTAGNEDDGDEPYIFESTVIYLNPNALGELSGDTQPAIEFKPLADLMQELGWILDEFNRAALISISGVIQSLAVGLRRQAKNDTGGLVEHSFIAAVVEWGQGYDQRP